mmetsp:Transcript_23449/g.49526  ORF Transcript_23449/g.49526 Transcript_23449/m.49526 type:complete len:86 (+) Transcript_23449:2605-2862(+)
MRAWEKMSRKTLCGDCGIGEKQELPRFGHVRPRHGSWLFGRGISCAQCSDKVDGEGMRTCTSDEIEIQSMTKGGLVRQGPLEGNE